MLMEFFIAWYSGDPYERWVFGHRLVRPHLLVYGLDADRHQRVRDATAVVQKNPREPAALFIIGVLINIGMWTRTLRHRRRLAVSGFSAGELGQIYSDHLGHRLYVGTLGAFFMMYLLFVKFLPMIAISEVKGAMPQANPHHPLGGAKEEAAMKHYGIIAEFDSPAAILHAAEKVRDAGYRRWDVFTPFPIHGMDKVMKLATRSSAGFRWHGAARSCV
jgi:hypothetical protein